MEKEHAVASLGLASLLQPGRLRAALKANDRIKLCLTLLQAAAGQAQSPGAPLPDFRREIASAGIEPRTEAEWLQELPATATPHGDGLRMPALPRLAHRLHDDLAAMARPLLEAADVDPALTARVEPWLQRLHALAEAPEPVLGAAELAALTHARHGAEDSLHKLVMALHKALNALAARLATREIAGAHTWQLAADGSDDARVAAFMRGLDRTRALKGDHPGLDTSATRDGPRLMIQNDIGTNDAHVLVLQVDTAATPPRATLTYSDLHRQRFAFFQRLLAQVGARWSEDQTRRQEGLNAGEAFQIGTAQFEPEDEAALQQQLEGIGERVVFLIDWNRARKRLLPFVDRNGAVAVLEAATRRRCGHRAWLAAGGERLVWNAMAAQGAATFRLGDRLDTVLGDEAARDFLVDVLALASRAAGNHQPASLVEDEARALLARRLHGRRSHTALLEEHAALCHALAQALRDAITHGGDADPAAARRLGARAKDWEQQADQLVLRARNQAERQRTPPIWLRLIERADDVADALEEACFVFDLAAEHLAARAESRAAGHDGRHRHVAVGFAPPLRALLGQLAETVTSAVQDEIKALAIVATLGSESESADHDEFLAACWRVQQSERRADELLRQVRRALTSQAREDGDAVALALGTDLAASIEEASDALLLVCHGLRETTLHRIEASTP